MLFGGTFPPNYVLFGGTEELPKLEEVIESGPMDSIDAYASKTTYDLFCEFSKVAKIQSCLIIY